MKKKLLAIFLVLVLAMSMVACEGSSAVGIDYGDAESFEAALEAGENLEGKVVSFEALELHPDSAFGYNVYAGKHLNFVSSGSPGVNAGDIVTVKVDSVDNLMGSWIIQYEKVNNAKVTDATIFYDGPSDDGKGVEIVESGYTLSDEYVNYAVVMENKSETTAFEYHKILITAYDANGDVLATEEQTMNEIQPGEKQMFASSVNCNGETPATVEFEMDSGDAISASDQAVKSSDLEISGTNERGGSFGSIKITGKITNNSVTDTDDVGVTVIFRKDGKILMGETSYIDELSASQSKAFELSAWSVPDHDSYEVLAFDWGF